MANNENGNKKSVETRLHQKDIEYLQRDINNLSDRVERGFEGVTKHLESFSDSYVHKDLIEKEFARMWKSVDKKADNQEFQEVKTILTRINWTILSTIVVAILSLIFIGVS